MCKRVPVATMVLLIMFLVISGCKPRTPKGEVLVYVCAPLSGWQADGGQTVVGGVNLMAKRINESGGLLGYRVNVVAVDDEADDDVAAEVAQQIADAVRSGQAGSRVMVLAPLVRGRKGAHREVFDQAKREGYVRARVDGELVALDKPPSLNKKLKQSNNKKNLISIYQNWNRNTKIIHR